MELCGGACCGGFSRLPMHVDPLREVVSSRIVTKEHSIQEKPTHRINAASSTPSPPGAGLGLQRRCVLACWGSVHGGAQEEAAEPTHRIIHIACYSVVGNSCPFLTNLPFHEFLGILCSPNEDFGRSDEHFRVRFRSTCQLYGSRIEYSHP